MPGHRRTEHEAPTPRPARRALVRGAAWAVPTLVVSTAAPALAASPPNGLQGWVSVGKTCGSSTNVVTIDGTGDYPDRGLWVTYVPAGVTPTAARVSFYYPNGLNPSFANDGSTGWTVPATGAAGVTPISGFTAYTTTYSGTWTRQADGTTMVANNDPKFVGTITNSLCTQTIQVYAERSVKVGNETITFTRGPVNL